MVLPYSWITVDFIEKNLIMWEKIMSHDLVVSDLKWSQMTKGQNFQVFLFALRLQNVVSLVGKSWKHCLIPSPPRNKVPETIYIEKIRENKIIRLMKYFMWVKEPSTKCTRWYSYPEMSDLRHSNPKMRRNFGLF